MPVTYEIPTTYFIWFVLDQSFILINFIHRKIIYNVPSPAFPFVCSVLNHPASCMVVFLLVISRAFIQIPYV